MNMNKESFGRYFQTIPNSELLDMIENPDNYQVLAVEAAKLEFSKRQLSNDEINAAKSLLFQQREKNNQQSDKIKSTKIKLIKATESLANTFNPIQSTIPTIDKTIRIIVIVFGILSIYQIINNYTFILAYLHDLDRSPYLTSFLLLPYIVLPIGIVLFWLRKSLGWIFLAIFLTYSGTGIIWILTKSSIWSGSSDMLNNIFPQPSVSLYILESIFIFGALFAICKKELRNRFTITTPLMLRTIFGTGVLSYFSFLLI